MDTNDVIIIKFIVTYYCLSACSIHRYGEAIAHAQTACCKLKPHLLRSNHCHVEILQSHSVSLTGLLANQVMSVVYGSWRKPTLGTDFSWQSPCCQQSQPTWTLPWSPRSVDRVHFSSQSVCYSRATLNCKTNGAGISYRQSTLSLIATNFVVTLSSCLCTRLWNTKALLFLG